MIRGSLTSVRAPIVFLAILLGLFFFRLVDTAVENSFTADEPHYVGTGLYLWRTGDYQWDRVLNGHPPLTAHLASLPLLALPIDTEPKRPDVGFQLIESGQIPSRTLRLASRLPFILLASWGAVLVFSWAREVGGPWAGVLGAFLYTSCPMILAYAPLAHSDITVSVLYLQTLYAFWRWGSRPTRFRFLLCGLSLGLALMAKLSAILLLVVLAILLGGRALSSGVASPGGISWARGLRGVAGAFGVWVGLVSVAVAVLWLGYGGSFAASPAPKPFEGYPLPGYLWSLFFDVRANAAGRTTYLFGEYSKEGWWYFFPVAFALKTPLPVSLLLLVALASRSKNVAGRPAFGAVIGVTAIVYLFVASFVLKVPLGIRYILPLYPLMHVFIAARLAGMATPWRNALAGVCCAWLFAASAWIHPHYLAYFNELVGGPRDAQRYLVESNLDWGQDLGTLAVYLRSRGNPPVHLAYFGPERPEAYGIRAVRLRGCEPVEGLVAISVNVLMELYRPGFPTAPPRGCYDWLRKYEPVARPGYSMRVFEIPHRT